MPLYTFNMCKADGDSVTFEFFDLPTDGDAFLKSGDLLDGHPSCDHVEVWDDDRPVFGRHRLQPVIRELQPRHEVRPDVSGRRLDPEGGSCQT